MPKPGKLLRVLKFCETLDKPTSTQEKNVVKELDGLRTEKGFTIEFPIPDFEGDVNTILTPEGFLHAEEVDQFGNSDSDSGEELCYVPHDG